ncbi:MAG: T9SS type A sorting domain-containing protein [Bacteroidota bacterium]
MKKKLLIPLIVFAFAACETVNAQCTPDPVYTGAGNPGIFPTPAEGIAEGDIGTAYFQNMTVIVAADTTINTADYGLPLGTITVPINSITITNITGLPANLTSTCDPPSCLWAGGTDGCFYIDGIPTATGTSTVTVMEVVNIETPAYPPLWAGGPFDLPESPAEVYELTINDTATVTCDDPTGLTASNITQTSADLSWTAANVGDTYIVEWGLQGFAPGSGINSATGTSVTGTNTESITGLTANTGYDFYVIEVCGIGDTSNLVGPEQFSTDSSVGINVLNIPKFDIIQNTPNPFTMTTKIIFTTPVAGMVELAVFNLLGNQVYYKNINAKASTNTIKFNSGNLTPGMYFYSLSDGEVTLTKRMIIADKLK